MKRVTGLYEVRKKRKLVDETGKATGFTTDPDGYLECTFVIEVDEDKLVQAIGRKAAFSSRGVSKLQGGAVIVRVVKSKRIQRGEKF